jgi:hypothetical protein
MRGTTLSLVIPDAAAGASMRVYDALWRRSGIQTHVRYVLLDSEFTRLARAPE